MKLRDVIVLLPCQSLEDLPLEQTAEGAGSILAAWSAPFHPSVLVSLRKTPRWSSAENPPEGEELASSLVLVPEASRFFVPKGWMSMAESAGTLVLDATSDRPALIRTLLEHVDAEPGFNPPEDANPERVADLLALGSCFLQVELLTRQLRYMSSLDEGLFQTEVLRAAEAILRGQDETAGEHIQRGFEVLTEGREYFYPVDAHLLDLTLVAPTTLGPALGAELDAAGPGNLLLSGQTLEQLAAEQPGALGRLAERVAQGDASVAGGPLRERHFGLLWPESILAELRRGLEVYRRRLNSPPAAFASRRMALCPLMPGVLAGLGIRRAIHLAFDGSRFPVGNQSKIRWEGPDASAVEALARVPLDAAGADAYLVLPERLGQAMDLDHTATVVLAHWPGGASLWREDLARMSHFAPALGRFVSLGEYFDQTEGAGQPVRRAADAYRSNCLADDVAAARTDPVSRWVRYHRRRVAVDALAGLGVLRQMIAGRPGTEAADVAARIADEVEDVAAAEIEPPPDDLDARIERAVGAAVQAVAEALPSRGEAPGPGWLAFNPWSFSRRMIPQAAPSKPCATASREAVASEKLIKEEAVSEEMRTRALLVPSSGTHADQQSHVQRTASCDVPAMGFAWVAAASDVTAAGVKPPRRRFWHRARRPEPPLAEPHVLRNEFFEITLDPATGAVRSTSDYQSRSNRLSMQLALRMPQPRRRPPAPEADEDVERDYSIMAADAIEVALSGPCVGQIDVRGRLVSREGEDVARFAQSLRARRGSRVLEVEIALEPERLPEGDPWQSYYAARFAWGDAGAELARSVNLGGWPTELARLEAPQYIDVRAGRRRTTFLTAGLPFHRRFGPRKLDTILVVRGETARQFRLGVGIDLAHPAAAAIDFLSPETMIREPVRAPASPSGWLFHLDVRHVVATHWEPLAEGARLVGFRVRLLETEGLHAPARLRSFRPIAEARRIDFGGQPLDPLPVDADAIALEIRPYQWLAVEARWEDAG